MKYDEFIDAVAQRAAVTAGQAEVLTRATLSTLAERISGGEARDLASQLPKALQDPLSTGEELAESFELEEFVRRVSERAGVDPAQALEGIRAVLSTVRDAVTGGEFDDVMSQLPKEFTALVEPTVF
jgi:uncharacterized protein (DUF2267 family)